MNIYSVLLIGWMLFSVAMKHVKIGGSSNSNRKKKIILISFVVVFGILLGFRGKYVGTDTWLYSNIFVESGVASNVFRYYMFARCPVYVLVCRFLYTFSQSANTMMIFSAFVTLGCVAYFIYKKSEDITMSVYLYIVLDYYLYSFNASRQLLAMSLLLVAYLKFEDGKKKAAIIIWLAAVGVHSLVMLFAIAIPLYFIRLNHRRFVYISAGIFLVEAFAMQALGLFQRLSSQYSDLSAVGYNLGAGDSRGFRIVYAILFFLLEILACVYSAKKSKWIYKEEYLRLLLIINVGLFSMIIYRHFYIFARVEKIFCQFLIILVPLIYRHLFKNRNLMIINAASYVIFFIPFLSQTANYLPYYLWGMQ